MPKQTNLFIYTRRSHPGQTDHTMLIKPVKKKTTSGSFRQKQTSSSSCIRLSRNTIRRLP